MEELNSDDNSLDDFNLPDLEEDSSTSSFDEFNMTDSEDPFAESFTVDKTDDEDGDIEELQTSDKSNLDTEIDAFFDMFDSDEKK